MVVMYGKKSYFVTGMFPVVSITPQRCDSRLMNLTTRKNLNSIRFNHQRVCVTFQGNGPVTLSDMFFD